jgi:hypothetical protein
MGNAVKTFVVDVGKSALKGVTSHVLGTYIPYVGSGIANYINSKYKSGTFAIGEPEIDVGDRKTKAINTPTQLKALVKEFPEQAKKAGLSIEMIDQEVKDAKSMSKAVGGMIDMKKAFAKGKMSSNKKNAKVSKSLSDKKKPRVKKARTAAQLAATKKLVEANRLRREKK